MSDPLRPELRAAITTVDGWEMAEEARMVTRAEFESALPIGSMVTHVLTKLLALAADKSGRIANDEPSEIFDKHILAAMEMEPRTMSLLRSVTTLGLQW